MTRKNHLFLIPAGVSLVICLAALFGWFANLDWAVFDLCLGARAEPYEDPAILLVDFDDTAMAEVGTWPVGRDVTADGLALLGELGARTVVFDIEYVDASPRGVDVRFLEENIPEYFNQGFGSLSENIQALFGAIVTGQIPLAEAESFIDDLAGLSSDVKDQLLAQVHRVAADNDARLGRAALLMGSTYFTVNMRDEPVFNASKEASDLAMIVAALPGAPIINGSMNAVMEKVDIWPTIPSILKRAAGAGFPNVSIDADGVRRRIDLLFRYQDRLFAQLVFAPYLKSLGWPTLQVTKQRIRLIDAKLPSGETKTVDIPLTEDGRMLIDWPHKSYMESFSHLSFRELIIHDRLFADLTHNLKIREDWGYYSFYDGLESPVELAERAAEYRRACLEDDGIVGNNSRFELKALRDEALEVSLAYLEMRPEDLIVEQLQVILESAELDSETRSQFEFMIKDAPEYFEQTRAIARDLAELRERLEKRVAGSFIITGWTSTGTTDIGVNPFDSEYVNVGTHAAVLNTIQNGSFLVDSPLWLTILIAVVASFGLSIVIRGQPPFIEIIIGLVWVVILAGLLVMVFIFTGRWIGPMAPVAASALTFLVSTIVSFLRTERDKAFLRTAFSHYLSAEVIREIVADPSRLKLGGVKKRMTALFTDIRGFSTISEKLSPEDLVRLLNRYLTGMSDVILDLKGTIDKYEGDAIIAFFGAPLDLDDHAYRGCLAAVQMKRIETSLNEKFLLEGMAPLPLLTRVGINTGDMVVGNMGTNRKMDYTIIGDSVNLAARLEGVNKQYGTWLCVSETTKEEAGDSFFFRRLDRIRVVGKSEPIQIFELVEEKSHLDAKQLEFYSKFDEAMNLFEQRDWKASQAAFSASGKLKTDDGPNQIYLDRCAAYIKKPPAADWDGVFTLTMK